MVSDPLVEQVRQLREEVWALRAEMQMALRSPVAPLPVHLDSTSAGGRVAAFQTNKRPIYRR